MSNLNLLLYINAYNDTSSQNPAQNAFKWTNQQNGLDCVNPESKQLTLQPDQEFSVHASTVSTSAASNTTFDIDLKTGTATTYQFKYNSGTAPAFRTARAIGTLTALSSFVITKSGKVLTLTCTELETTAIVVGDYVRLASPFSNLNQGEYKILTKGTNFITISNTSGIAETVVLGANFATNFIVYSAAGVQIGQNLSLIANVSPVSIGSYIITDVTPTYLEFESNNGLPEETGIVNTTSCFTIYDTVKTFLYIQSSAQLELTLNSATLNINPMVMGTALIDGLFLNSGDFYTITLKNIDIEAASIYYVTAE